MRVGRLGFFAGGCVPCGLPSSGITSTSAWSGEQEHRTGRVDESLSRFLGYWFRSEHIDKECAHHCSDEYGESSCSRVWCLHPHSSVPCWYVFYKPSPLLCRNNRYLELQIFIYMVIKIQLSKLPLFFVLYVHMVSRNCDISLTPVSR